MTESHAAGTERKEEAAEDIIDGRIEPSLPQGTFVLLEQGIIDTEHEHHSMIAYLSMCVRIAMTQVKEPR